jgi:hypothetical protein
VLASIGIPSFSAARNKIHNRTKQANIRLLNDIIQEWAFYENAGDNSPIGDGITNYLRGGIEKLSVGQDHVSLTNITSKTVSYTFTVTDLY